MAETEAAAYLTRAVKQRRRWGWTLAGARRHWVRFGGLSGHDIWLIRHPHKEGANDVHKTVAEHSANFDDSSRYLLSTSNPNLYTFFSSVYLS